MSLNVLHRERQHTPRDQTEQLEVQTELSDEGQKEAVVPGGGSPHDGIEEDRSQVPPKDHPPSGPFFQLLSMGVESGKQGEEEAKVETVLQLVQVFAQEVPGA